MSDTQSLLSILYDKAVAVLDRMKEYDRYGSRGAYFVVVKEEVPDFLDAMYGAQPRWDEVADWPEVFEAAHRELIRRW